jgi:hypothetical protein
MKPHFSLPPPPRNETSPRSRYLKYGDGDGIGIGTLFLVIQIPYYENHLNECVSY